MENITLNGWVNALNYTSAGIIAYGYFDETSQIIANNVTF